MQNKTKCHGLKQLKFKLSSWPFMTSHLKETSLFSSEFYYKTHLVIFSRTAKFTSLFFVGLTVCWTGTGIPKKSVVGRNDGKGPSDHDAEPLERLVFNAILL